MTKTTDCLLPRGLMLSLALFQGLGLLALDRAVALDVWPASEAFWLYPLYSVVLAGPLMLLLACCRGSVARTLKIVSPFIVVAAALAAYTGWQSEPHEVISTYTLVPAFVLTMGIACFKAVMYVQHFRHYNRLSYATLFLFSWRNFLVVGLALLSVLIFWGILMLWAALFKSIGIGFFDELFDNDWFLYPVLGLVNGIAITVFRNLTSVIDVIAGVLQALIKYLLPVLVVVSVTFLAALPFTGLEVLWNTGSGSLRILWLQALTLFFVNAVYQDETRESPYSPALHRFVYVGVAVLPVYSVIAFYGLYLRVLQHGWTVERGWGMLIWLLLAMFAIGYLWGIVRHRDGWIQTLSRVNIAMGLVVMVFMLLMNSPLLDLRKVALHSQLARLERGDIDLQALDIGYIREHLARPGYLALQSLKDEVAVSHPDIAENIEKLYSRNNYEAPDLATLSQDLTVWPAGSQVPDELLRALLTELKATDARGLVNRQYVLIRADLDADGVDEYVFIRKLGSWGRVSLWQKPDDYWRSRDMWVAGDWAGTDITALADRGEVVISRPRWRQLQIGGLLFQVMPQQESDRP
jgi:hypothetical protein